MTRKRPHCCTLCDEVLWDVKATHPETGEPARIGQPLEHAWRARLVLVDGATTTLTFCEKCLPAAAERLPEIWRRCLAAFVHERDGRALAPERAAANEADLRRLIDNVPLGILAARKWSEEAA